MTTHSQAHSVTGLYWQARVENAPVAVDAAGEVVRRGGRGLVLAPAADHVAAELGVPAVGRVAAV